MKTAIKICSAIAIALTAVATPALAGGSIKDGPVGVPVPAPKPIPDYYGQYYLRLDVSYAWADANRFDTGNELYDQSRRRDDGLSEGGRYGFGIGMNLSRWLRADVTIDTRDEANGFVNDQIQYMVGLDTVTDTLTDTIRYRNGTGLANIYVDMPFTPKLTPYVGVGVGLALHSVSRSLAQTINCTDGSGGLGYCPGGFSIGNQVSDKDYQWAFAGALMTGFSYQISDALKTDIGYRWLHIDGAKFSHWVGTQMAYQPLKIPDQNIHELRLGLRWDIQ